MNDEHITEPELHQGGIRGFLSSLMLGLFRDLMKFVIAFGVGTGGSAIVCWYYGLPLALALAGGFIVLALALTLSTDSIFS